MFGFLNTRFSSGWDGYFGYFLICGLHLLSITRVLKMWHVFHVVLSRILVLVFQFLESVHFSSQWPRWSAALLPMLRCYSPAVSACSYYSWIVCKLYANSRNVLSIVLEPRKSKKTRVEAVLESREDCVFASNEVFHCWSWHGREVSVSFWPLIQGVKQVLRMEYSGQPLCQRLLLTVSHSIQLQHTGFTEHVH